jgi:hypothetical protein
MMSAEKRGPKENNMVKRNVIFRGMRYPIIPRPLVPSNNGSTIVHENRYVIIKNDIKG